MYGAGHAVISFSRSARDAAVARRRSPGDNPQLPGARPARGTLSIAAPTVPAAVGRQPVLRRRRGVPMNATASAATRPGIDRWFLLLLSGVLVLLLVAGITVAVVRQPAPVLPAG